MEKPKPNKYCFNCRYEIYPESQYLCFPVCALSKNIKRGVAKYDSCNLLNSDNNCADHKRKSKYKFINFLREFWREFFQPKQGGQ